MIMNYNVLHKLQYVYYLILCNTVQIAVAWGTEVVIFEPERVLEESSGSTEVCIVT